MNFLKFTISILLLSVNMVGQSSSGIIATSRATDWTKAGVQGGIPSASWTQFGSTIAAYSGNANTINTALTNCGAAATPAAPRFILLGNGTFNISTQLVFIVDNCVLRGGGADLTKIVAGIGSDGGGCSFFFGYFFRMCKGSANQGTTVGGGSGPQNTAGWTGTVEGGVGVYPQGARRLNLANVTNLFVGAVIMIDQIDDPSDGWPSAGFIWECSNAPACSSEGGNSWARVNRVHVEYHAVTQFNEGGCGATCVSIDPPIINPDYRASQTPQAWWGSSTTLLSNFGLEDMSIDFSADNQIGLLMENVGNFWMKGVRIIHTGGAGSFLNHLTIIHGFRGTIKDNYFYGPAVQGNTQYAYTVQPGGSMLFENNIMHHNVTPMAANDPESGSVYSYNYCDDPFYSSGPQPHNAADSYILWEGNDCGTIAPDDIHGPHFFLTFYRNAFNGKQHSQGGVAYAGGLVLLARNRMHNMLANVFGSQLFTRYEADQIFQTDGSCTNCGTNNEATVYSFGWKESSTANDPNVKSTSMRYCNWDSVTSSNKNASNDQTGTRAVSGEVPTGIANFPNTVPGVSCTSGLVASYYLNSKPSWFPSSVPWPPIGPDVASGNSPNTVAYPTGGHANLIPARVCFAGLANDPGYPSSNPRIKIFNAATCYAAAGGSPTASFDNLSLTFPSQNLNTTSTGQTITLTNTGTAVLSITSIGLSGTNPGDYFQSNNCPIGGNLGISSSCVVTVTFTPLATGARTATVIFTDSAVDSPQTVTLSGTGISQGFALQLNGGVKLNGQTAAH